ncbi:MAG: arcB 2 [Burkholderiales bacterium]|jgi:PAS domain-containing protein|nr:arcB 2 [Burkholderiales bacterium]
MELSSYNNYLELFSSLPGSVYLADINNIYQWCNEQQALSLKFSSPKDIIGKKNIDLPCFSNHIELVHVIDNNNLKVLETLTITIFKEKYFDFNGNPVTYISTKIPIYYNKGCAIGLISISVKEHDKEDNLLAEKKEYTKADLQNIIQYMPEYVMLKDINGVYLACNEAQAHCLGFQSGDDLIGKTDFDLPTQKMRAEEIIQDDAIILSRNSATIFEENLKVNGKEIKVITKKAPLKNRFQEPISVINVSVYISETRILEDQIWLLEHIIGSVPGHVWWKDKNLGFLEHNDQQAIDAGFESKDIIKNKTAQDLALRFITFS